MTAAQNNKQQNTTASRPDNSQPPASPQVTPVDVQSVIGSEPSKDQTYAQLRYHVWTAMGVGLIPVPVVDLVALTGVHVNLLRVLAKMYHVPFRKGIMRNILSSLIGGAIPVATAPTIAVSLAKAIPMAGQTVGVVTMPIMAGASTYALGRVFIQHFASGGTFLTFDPESVKEYYAEMLQEGQTVAEELQSQ